MSSNFPPPPGPPPSYQASRDSDTTTSHTPMPPNRQGQRVAFAPVTSQPGHSSNFAPPEGPPPSHVSARTQAKPGAQGPSPSKQDPAEDPPPYHDWTVIPDTALLPPPPNISYKASPTTNASTSESDRGQAFTNANPLWPPRSLSEHEQRALSIQFSSLIRPREFLGTLTSNREERPGVFQVASAPQCQDCCLLSSLPLYSAMLGSPAVTGSPCKAYYEITIRKLMRDSSVAIGFIAAPYPSWRMPGWERGSLGVHGDDGRKFVNDAWGGTDFTKPFRAGETLGIGISFTPQSSTIEAKVFFTRNGKHEGGWDVHEEVDAEMDQPGGVTGLEGHHDLFAAIGIFGGAEFDVVFGRHNWKYKVTDK